MNGGTSGAAAAAGTATIVAAAARSAIHLMPEVSRPVVIAVFGARELGERDRRDEDDAQSLEDGVRLRPRVVARVARVRERSEGERGLVGRRDRAGELEARLQMPPRVVGAARLVERV